MQIRLAADFQTDSIVDGIGIRTVIWTQGCSHNCPDCHNPSTHSFKAGELVDLDDVLEKLETLTGQDGITLSGGDPFFQAKQCFRIAKKAHELGLNVWAYTGFTFEEIIEKGSEDVKKLLSEIDVLIDGKYIKALKSLNLEFRGSSNQRIIDVKKSLEKDQVVLLDTNQNKENKKRENIFI